jgi:hypothetical protein
MESSGKYSLDGSVDVDDFLLTARKPAKKGRGKEDQRLVVFAIGKRNKGISPVCMAG